jgi:hypothetical protein
MTTMTSAAALLLLCSGPMAVQAQQKGPEQGGPSQAQQGGQQGTPAGKAESRGNEGGEAKGGKQQQAEPKDKDAGKATKSQAQDSKQQPTQKQAEPKDKDAGKATKSQAQDSKQQPTQKQAEPKDKDAGKATKSQAQDSKQQPTQKQAEPKDKDAGKATKSQAQDSKQQPAQQQAEPKSKDTGTTTKGQAQDNNQQRTQQQAQPSGKATTGGQGQRVQISQEQRTTIRQTILGAGQVNRVQNVNVRVNVGSRIPSGIRLAPLPATVVSIVPAYRSYSYFVVSDEIYIVEPQTLVVVDVIHVSGPDRGGSQSAALTLSQDERRILVRTIEIRRDSTLGLGALEIGASVPRGVEVVEFPSVVVEEVPKLRGYHYFTAENAIVIVEPSRDRIALVIEAR